MSDWKTVPLASLVENLDSRRVPVKRSERQSGLYPYYGASGIVDWVGSYLFDGEHLLVAEDGENLNSRSVPIAFRATGKFWVNNHAHILKGPTHLLRYLEHFLNNLDVAGWVTGYAQPKLTQGNLNSIPIYLPTDDDELKAIARVLGALDDKIELNRRMNRTLEELAAALFRSWFVDFDPVVAKAAGRKPAHLRPELAALFPDTFQDSDLGPIPKGWQVLPLGDLCTLKRGYDLAGAIRKPGNVPVISSAGFKSSHSEAKVKGPGVITGRYGTIGDDFFVEEDFWPLNTTLYVQDFKGHPVRFIFHALQGIDYGIYSDKAAVPGINRNDLHQEKIICPPAAVESEFDRLTDRFWKQHSANERESRTLAALRDTLLPKLLSGELRVKPAEKLVEATA